MKTIDYSKIAKAVEYYKTYDYCYMEVPWLVDLDSILVTRPKGARLFSTFAGELVASGEQSFIEIQELLQKGKKYQCVTPCFRDDKIDELHDRYFLKNELIWIPKYTDVPYSGLVDKMIEEVLPFFSNYGKPEVVDFPLENAWNNKDIMINGIEVGSYGCREYNGFMWIYGTGCAEPRLSTAIDKSKNS